MQSTSPTKADNSAAAFSCALVDGKVLGHDNESKAQKQSLFARSAALQRQQKSLGAALNCERTLIVDFDSSVADNNNTFVCPTSSHSKLLGGNSLRNDEQRSAHKSRFGETPSLYGTIPLRGHHTNTAAISRHRLLFAQINAREYKLLRDAESKTCEQLVQTVCACPINPETHVGAPQSHSFAITEKFCIDECNQTLSVESNRTQMPFVLPKTKTGIRAIECVRAEALQQYFCGAGAASVGDFVCGSALHLRVETCEAHNFVPGLKFALLNASNLVPANIDADPALVDTYEPCPKLATLLHRAETTVYEVYDVLTPYLVLAVPVTCKKSSSSQHKAPSTTTTTTTTTLTLSQHSPCDIAAPLPCDTVPWHNSVIANTMFRRKTYQHVQREHLCKREDEKHFYGRFVAGLCGVATAYIRCPTSPQQLAAFANQLAEASFHAGMTSGGDVSVEAVTYDATQDEFTVTFRNSAAHCADDAPLKRRTKNLLASAEHYSTLSLSRNAMLATASCPAAKSLYLNRALRGAYYFEIVRNVNDRLTLLLHIAECAEVRCRIVTLPAGVFRASELVACLSERLNAAAESERACFEFQVDFTLHPTDGLLAWQQCGIGASAKKLRQNFPTLGTSPYESQTFGFLISNVKPHRFALDFSRAGGCASTLAVTLDFDAHRTEFALRHGSRSLATAVALPADACTKPSVPPCKTPTLRALYTASIDDCTGLVTIKQRGISSLYCDTLNVHVVFSRDAACCHSGPDNVIELPDDCAVPCSDPCAATAASDARCVTNAGCTTAKESAAGAGIVVTCEPSGAVLYDNCKPQCAVCGSSANLQVGNTCCYECDNSSCDDKHSDASDQSEVSNDDSCCHGSSGSGGGSSSSSSTSDGGGGGGGCKKKKCCEPHQAYLVFQLPSAACEPSVLPLLAGDVVWLTYGCRTIGACVMLVWRDCCDLPAQCDTQHTLVRYKVALAYGARALYNDLRGTDGERCLPSYLPVRMRLEPLGFNLHMNPAATLKHMLDSTLPVVRPSAQSAISKWLGFRNARTLSERRFYTSDSCVQSLLDERLLLSIPEINNYGRKQPRYGVQSPFDTALTRHYGVLTLDRPSGVYKYDNSTDSMAGFLDQHACNADSCPNGCSAVSGSTPETSLSFHLLRSDGSAYVSCGDTLVVSVEICFAN